MSKQIIMHFSNGSTLTGDDLYPHELSEEQNQQLTSVERVIGGWHLTILKSPLIKSFFVMTTAFQDMTLKPGRQGPAPEIAMRSIGCYIKDSNPPIRLTLNMAPSSKNVQLHVERVNSFRPDGFAKPLKPMGKMYKVVNKQLGRQIWGIVDQPPIVRVYPSKEGIGCIIEVKKEGTDILGGPLTSRIMAELNRSGNNCQLLITSG